MGRRGEDQTTRRMRRGAMLTATIALAPVCTLGVVLTATSWWEALVLAAGNLAVLGVLNQWSLDAYPRRALAAFVFCLASWLLCALTASTPLGFFAAAVVGGLLLARLTHRRLMATSVLVLGMTVLGAAVFLTHSISRERIDLFILLPALGTLFIVGVITASEQSWLMVRRVTHAKEIETELSLAQERARFAGDLHDIQGHTLHVIKLKAAVAQSDPLRADAELADIRRLIDDTIAKTRELAYAQHEIRLDTELENARRLCEAAGIAVTLRLDGTLSTAHPLLAHVLREATTNLLRHATPSTVTITASASRVTVANDGVPQQQTRDLRGLARLGERIRGAGGALHIDRAPGEFAVGAELAPDQAAYSA